MNAFAIAAAPHAVFRKLRGQGGGVLLHLRTTAYFRLNDQGATIWQLLDEETTIDDLVDRMRTMYPDAPPELNQDVARFVEELIERDLLVSRQLS